MISHPTWEALKGPAWMKEGYALMARLSHNNIAKVVAEEYMLAGGLTNDQIDRERGRLLRT
jgi:hypothetical protein